MSSKNKLSEKKIHIYESKKKFFIDEDETVDDIFVHQSDLERSDTQEDKRQQKGLLLSPWEESTLQENAEFFRQFKARQKEGKGVLKNKEYNTLVSLREAFSKLNHIAFEVELNSIIKALEEKEKTIKEKEKTIKSLQKKLSRNTAAASMKNMQDYNDWVEELVVPMKEAVNNAEIVRKGKPSITKLADYFNNVLQIQTRDKKKFYPKTISRILKRQKACNLLDEETLKRCPDVK